MLQKQELMQLMHSDMTWIRNNLDICVPPWVMPLGATKMLLPHLPWQIGVSRRENTDYRLYYISGDSQSSNLFSKFAVSESLDLEGSDHFLQILDSSSPLFIQAVDV